MAGGSEGAGAGAACGAACGTAGPLGGSRASPAGLLVLLMLSIGDGRVGICAVHTTKQHVQSRDIAHKRHTCCRVQGFGKGARHDQLSYRYFPSDFATFVTYIPTVWNLQTYVTDATYQLDDAPRYMNHEPRTTNHTTNTISECLLTVQWATSRLVRC